MEMLPRSSALCVYNSGGNDCRKQNKKTCFYHNVTLVVLSKAAGTAVVVTRGALRVAVAVVRGHVDETRTWKTPIVNGTKL